VNLRAIFILLVVTLFWATSALAVDRRPKRSNPGTPAAASRPSPDTLVDLLVQMDVLQNEVRELRNLVEIQSNEIKRLKSQQRELLKDMDRRLTRLERGGGAVAPGPPQGGAPAKTVKAPPPPPPPGNRAQEQKEYDAAFGLMKQGFYEKAGQAFRRFIDRYPASPLAGNAQYWIAEANYVVRNFRRALEEFNKVIDAYPDSVKVPDAMLKLGYTYYELEEWGKAREHLTRVVQRYPNTRIAKSAERRLAKLKQQGH